MEKVSQFVHARVYWDGIATAVMRVVMIGATPGEPGCYIVELPWTKKGEPAGLLRRGMQVSLPAEEIIIDDEELQTSLDDLRITNASVQHAISEIVDKVTTRIIAIKNK
jgi:hypothetical protein